MSNILCGLDILDDSEIINQIAIMQAIEKINENIGINKTRKKIFKFANYFVSIFKDSDSNDLKEFSNIDLYIKDIILQFNKLDRNELIQIFKESLCNILSIDNTVSDDELCIKLINKSCELLKINLDEMPLYKAKKVYEKYNDFFKITYSDAIYRISDLYNKYKTINKNAIDLLNRGFSVERDLLLTDNYVISKGIETVISEVLLYITYLLSVFSMEKICISVNEVEKFYKEKSEKEFNELLLKVNNSQLHIMANNQKIISLKHDLRGFSLKITREEKKKSDCIENLNKLKLRKQDIAENIKNLEHELEIKKNNIALNSSEINDLDNDAKMNMDAEIFKLQNRINFLNNKLKNINNEGLYSAKSLENITSELKAANDKVNETNALLKEMELQSKIFIDSVDSDKTDFKNKSNERIKVIKHRWTEAFKEFTIKDEVYNSIKNFNSSELLKVEMAILEMSKMKDVSAISAGKIDKFYDYVILNTSKREPIKIFFEISPFGSLVKIEKIQKELVII